MIEDSMREMPLEDDIDAYEKGSELISNDMSPEDVKVPQELEDDSAKELSLHSEKEVLCEQGNAHGDEKESNGSALCHEIVKDDDKTPRVGMVFKTYDEALRFYKRYALQVGFGPIVLKSSYTNSGACRRLVLGCTRSGKGRDDPSYLARETAKTNCQAKIVMKQQSDDGFLHLVETDLEHNHPLNACRMRLASCQGKMSDAKKGDHLGEKVNSNLVRPNGRRSLQSGEKECGNVTVIGQLKFGEDDDESLYQFFASMQSKNPNFFYLVDLDNQGRLRNLLWADARSRSAHAYFGCDVIYFDTTYLIEKYDLPLVFFTGMNHHGQLVLFGCGLLSNQTKESYTWLFRAFLTCMLGRHPDAIITEDCKEVQGAVMEVFPRSRHRLCLSCIMKKLTEKLKGNADFKAIEKAFNRAALDSSTVDEFDEEWRKMVEAHGLENDEWIRSIYTDRHLWVPAFLKDRFWAGMSISRRGESMAAFFDGFVNSKTSLKQFFSKYETILEGKYKKEILADSESFQRTPAMATKFYMEEQLAKVYTINMFKKFQGELKATIYCHPMPTKVEGPLISFEVKECSYVEDGKRTDTKDHEVYFKENDLVVQCVCGSFQFNGILCRHALSVFKLQQVYEIPSSYILDRWKKDYKKLYASAHSCDHELPINDAADRYDLLLSRCLQLVDLGFISDDRYLVALKLLKDAEKSLLDDTTLGDRQVKLLSFETRSIENVRGVPVSHFSEGNTNSESSNVKRRGRPPKRGRSSNPETLVQPNKEQDFLRSSLVVGEPNLLQSAPAASHLCGHLGAQGGIDLMEEISPNELPFGAHFGMDINHQHHVTNQPRMDQSNFLQAQYDHQTMGGQSRVQWIYQQMLQDDHTLRTPGRRTG